MYPVLGPRKGLWIWFWPALFSGPGKMHRCEGAMVMVADREGVVSGKRCDFYLVMEMVQVNLWWCCAAGAACLPVPAGR